MGCEVHGCKDNNEVGYRLSTIPLFQEEVGKGLVAKLG